VEFRGVFVTPANGANSVDSLRKPVRGVLDRPSALTTRFRVFGSRDQLKKASLVEGERLVRDDIDQGERRRDRQGAARPYQPDHYPDQAEASSS